MEKNKQRRERARELLMMLLACLVINLLSIACPLFWCVVFSVSGPTMISVTIACWAFDNVAFVLWCEFVGDKDK